MTIIRQYPCCNGRTLASHLHVLHLIFNLAVHRIVALNCQSLSSLYHFCKKLFVVYYLVLEKEIIASFSYIFLQNHDHLQLVCL